MPASRNIANLGDTGASDETYAQFGKFHMNPTAITANYTTPANTNLGTFGPITIGVGVTVTVPPSSTWTIV